MLPVFIAFSQIREVRPNLLFAGQLLISEGEKADAHIIATRYRGHSRDDDTVRTSMSFFDILKSGFGSAQQVVKSTLQGAQQAASSAQQGTAQALENTQKVVSNAFNETQRVAKDVQQVASDGIGKAA